MLRSGIGRQIHVFTNACDNASAQQKLNFEDVHSKQLLSRASIRTCDLDKMVTLECTGVTPYYHSTAGMYFYEEGLVEWITSLRNYRRRSEIDSSFLSTKSSILRFAGSFSIFRKKGASQSPTQVSRNNQTKEADIERREVVGEP